MCLATPSYVSDVPLKLIESNISTKHNRLKNPNWREEDRGWSFTRMNDELNRERQLLLSGESGT